MADQDLAKLVTTLEVNMRNFEKKLKTANDNSRTKAKSIQRNFDKANKGVSAGFQKHFGLAARAVGAIDGPLGGVAGRLSSFGSLAGGAGVALGGFTAALTASTFAAYKALKAYQEFETQQLVTEQVLRATGNSAGQTSASIEALAQSVGMTTLASITDARKAATQLLTFRSIAGETFERTLRLSQDLATVGFGSLESSAKQLGKALEDPRTGLTQLRRVGVSFSEAQKQVIYDLYDTGRIAEAQGKILDALAEQVGGAGTASGQGLSGAYDTLSEATQLLLERWGGQIAEAFNLRAAIMGIAGAIDAVNQRASLGGQLRTVNKHIARTEGTRDPRIAGVPGMDNPFTRGKHAGADELRIEQELQELYAQRRALQMQMFREGEALSQASLDAIEAQRQAEKERADSVIADLTRKNELERLSNVEKQTSIALAKAGVVAESEAGKQIVALVQEQVRIEEEKRKARESDKSSDKAAKSATREQQAVEDLIDALQFEIAIMGLSEREQAVLIALRRAGAAATQDQIAQIRELAGLEFDRHAALEREKQAMGELRDLHRDVFSGFARDMRNGVTATEALANALNKVIDRLEDDVFDSLFGNGGGKRGGILDGVINGIGSLLGVGGGQLAIAAGGGVGLYHGGGTAGRPRQTKNVHPAIFNGAPRYHFGGIAGFEPLKPNEVPAILEEGERIIPNGMRNLSQGASLLTIRLVDDSGRMAAIADQRIDMVGGSIIFEAVKQARHVAAAELPGRLQNVQRHRRA